MLNKHLLLKLKMVVLLNIFGNSDACVLTFYDQYIILLKKIIGIYMCIYTVKVKSLHVNIFYVKYLLQVSSTK